MVSATFASDLCSSRETWCARVKEVEPEVPRSAKTAALAERQGHSVGTEEMPARYDDAALLAPWSDGYGWKVAKG